MAKSLIQNDALIYRKYAEEQLQFFGISAEYYQIKPGHSWTSVGELAANYYDPLSVKIMFDQVPKISTLKKLGWVTELDQSASLIHVLFTTPGISVGCVYNIKDPLQPNNGRLFRVTKLQTGIMYPSFVTCQIVPVIGTEPEETLDPYQGNKSVFLDKQKEQQDDVY